LRVAANTSAAHPEVAYVLRSNITDWSDAQVWNAYIQIAQAEAAFRIQKDQLRVRPICALLDRLGIVLPKRMRLAETEIPAIAISA
jgi:hypothetical protein